MTENVENETYLGMIQTLRKVVSGESSALPSPLVTVLNVSNMPPPSVTQRIFDTSHPGD